MSDESYGRSTYTIHELAPPVDPSGAYVAEPFLEFALPAEARALGMEPGAELDLEGSPSTPRAPSTS